MACNKLIDIRGLCDGLQYCTDVWLPQGNPRLPLNYKGGKASSKSHLWRQYLHSDEVLQDYSVSLKFPAIGASLDSLG